MSGEHDTDRYIERGSLDYGDCYGTLVRLFACRACGSLVAAPDRAIHDTYVHGVREHCPSCKSPYPDSVADEVWCRDPWHGVRKSDD